LFILLKRRAVTRITWKRRADTVEFLAIVRALGADLVQVLPEIARSVAEAPS
jgi:hypothetical protein